MQTTSPRRASGDERAAGYAECVLWIARVISDPELDVDQWESDADRLIAVFEGSDDPQGAALAWMQKSYALWFRLRLEDSGSAAERAIEHARIAGDGFVDSEMHGHHMATSDWARRPSAKRCRCIARRSRTHVPGAIGDWNRTASADLARCMPSSAGSRTLTSWSRKDVRSSRSSG